MARFLEINWEDASLASIARDGYGDSVQTLKDLVTERELVNFDGGNGARPVIVYIFDGEADPETNAKKEDEMFKDDDLAIASKIIRFIRIDGTRIPEKVRDDYAKKFPTFYLMNSQGEEVAKFSGNKKAKVLLSSLGKLYKKQWKGTLSSHIKRVDRHLVECEKLEDMVFSAQKRVTDLEARLAKKDKPSTRRNIEKAKKSVEELNKKLEAALEKRPAVLAGVPLKKAASKTN